MSEERVGDAMTKKQSKMQSGSAKGSVRSKADCKLMEDRFFTMLEEGKPIADLESVIATYPEVLLSSKDDKPGYTPLHCACACDKIRHQHEVIELLVRHNPGALQIVDKKNGFLPLNYYLHFYHCSLLNLSVVKLLVNAYPSSLHHRDRRGETPLFFRCMRVCEEHEWSKESTIETIEFLIEQYPQALQLKNVCDNTPLHAACQFTNNYSVIQLLYKAFPLAARWKNCNNKLPFTLAIERLGYIKTEASKNVTEYLAYECWPVACLVRYKFDYRYDAVFIKFLEDVTTEAVFALTDVAFHVKQILPDTVTQLMIEKAPLCSSVRSFFDVSANMLPKHYMNESSRYSYRVSVSFLSVLYNEELQRVLTTDDGHEELQDLLDSVIRMNRVDRRHSIEHADDKVKGIKVLQAACCVSALFFHIRENPECCNRLQVWNENQ